MRSDVPDVVGADRGPAREERSPVRSRRDLLRTGGVAVVASVAALLGRPLAASAQRDRRRRRSRDRGSDDAAESSAPPGQSIETSRSPALDVANTSRQGESVGIHGTAASPDGMAGLFVASGGGTALEARTGERGGTALRTRGRIQFMERSGVAPATGGAEFVIPVPGGVREDAIVLATLQDHEAGVHVESASVLDPEEGLIVIRLNQALSGPGRVGWIVLG
jgi:hypothetical protein